MIYLEPGMLTDHAPYLFGERHERLDVLAVEDEDEQLLGLAACRGRARDDDLAEIEAVKSRYPKNALIVSLMVESTPEAWHRIVRQAEDAGADGVLDDFADSNGDGVYSPGIDVAVMNTIMLQIRRSEKDFLLRGDAKYAERLAKLVGGVADLARAAGVPVVQISALAESGLERLITATLGAHEVWNRRVATPALNRWLRELDDLA